MSEGEVENLRIPSTIWQLVGRYYEIMATLEFYFLIMWQLVPIFSIKKPFTPWAASVFFCGKVAKIQPQIKRKKKHGVCRFHKILHFDECSPFGLCYCERRVHLMGTAWNISYFILSLVWSSPLLAWPGRSCSVPRELATSGRPFYQSAMTRDSTSNFVARSGLSF